MERRVISKLANGGLEYISPVVDIGVSAGIGYP